MQRGRERFDSIADRSVTIGGPAEILKVRVVWSVANEDATWPGNAG